MEGASTPAQGVESGDRHGPSLAKLRRLANAQKFDELETAWVVAFEEDRLAAADLVPIAGQVGRLGEPDRAGSLLWFLLSQEEECHGAAGALAAARQAAVELPDLAALRDELIRLYVAVHADYAELPELVEGTLSLPLPLPEAVTIVDRFVALRPGRFLRDPARFEPGVVVEVDSRAATVTARFGPHRREFAREELPQLTPLPDDHYRALLLYRPEELRTLATTQPAQFVRCALGAVPEGKLAYRELRSQVAQLLGEDAWTAWWGEARLLLKRDPRLEVSGSNQPTFRLLTRDISPEQRLREEFAALSALPDKLRLIVDYLDESGGAHPPDPDLLQHFGHAVARLAVGALPGDPVQALACLAVHAEIVDHGVAVPRPSHNAALQVVARVTEPAQMVHQLDDRVLRAVLAYVRAELPQRWPAIWSAVLPRANRRLAEFMARELHDSGHDEALAAALSEALARPTVAPDFLCWFWRARVGTRWSPIIAALNSREISGGRALFALLELADATGKLCGVSDEDRYRKTLALVQQTLAGPGSLPVREIAAAASTSEARRLKAAVEGNAGLSVASRMELLGYVRAAHPEIFIEAARPWEEDVTYTTAAGLDKRRSEFEQLVKVALPAVAKQIGEAAAHGDLSENSEYTAALEKRDQITSRASAMEKELNRARLITQEMMGSAFVNIGTHVRARDLVGNHEETYTFLGPWDADPEQHVLTYNAPLALAFMGRKPGETIVFGEPPHERKWEVLAVSPAP